MSLARIPVAAGAQDGEDLLVGGADHGRFVGGELGCREGPQGAAGGCQVGEFVVCDVSECLAWS